MKRVLKWFGYLMMMGGVSFLGLALFFVTCVGDYKTDQERCEYYVQKIWENSEFKSHMLVSTNDSLVKVYADSLNDVFHSMLLEDQIVMWDNYLEMNDTLNYCFHSNINQSQNDFGNKILKIIPDSYKSYIWELNSERYMAEILSQQHFDSSKMKWKTLGIRRFRVWETTYLVDGKITYENLFGGSVTNTVRVSVDRHGNVQGYILL